MKTNWTQAKNTHNAKVMAWAGLQMVRLLAANEGMEKWMRFDGETLVVRR